MDRLHKQLLIAVGVIVAVALGGLVALWPSQLSLPPVEPPGVALDGLVVGFTPYQGEALPEFGISGESAVIDIELLSGPDIGEVVQVDTQLDGYPDFSIGDRVRLLEVSTGEGVQYGIADFERGDALRWLVLLFVVVVIAVGGWHGARSLVGLALSLGVVVWFIVPAILGGASPFAVAFFGALTVMLVTLPLAHGVNAMTAAAVVGTAIALGLTIVLGVVFIDLAHLTGFSSEEANLARYAVEGLDPKGLVLAGLIIAALGVLDDVTVSQASTVFALRSANDQLGWSSLFGRAMSVGRDHIASTVNTLVLAYAGASLALLVLFSTSGVPSGELIGSEIIAEEIVKTLVGSIGLIAAVPLTTALATSLAIRANPALVGALATGHVHAHEHGHLHAEGDGVASSGADPDEKDYSRWIDELKYGPGGRGSDSDDS